MNKDGFTRATVVSVKNGRVVLRYDNGHYETIIHEPDPNITITVDEEPPDPDLPPK